MCQTLPGPRCSRHSKDRLERVSTVLDHAIKQYDKIKHGNQTEKKEQLLSRIDHLQATLSEAQRDYNSTPEGIEELQQRVQDQKLSRSDRADAEMSLHIALADREAHILAGKIYKRHQSLSTEDATQRQAYLQRERTANVNLANAMNTQQRVAEAGNAARVAKKNRLLFEEKLRRKVVGLSQVKQIPASTVTPQTNAFIRMKPSEFGRVSSYLPYGAYARVTKVDTTPEGNAILHIEGSVKKIVSRNTPLVTPA